MWNNSDKYNFHTAIFWSCSVLAMIALMAVGPILSITPQTNFAMGGLAAYFTVLILFSIQRLRRVHRTLWENQLQLTHEAKALNDHAILSITDREMRLCYVNQKFLDATGYAREDVIGRSPIELYDDGTQDIFLSITEHLQQGEVWTGETRLRCKDGQIMFSQTTVLPRTDEKGRSSGTIAVRTNVTELRRATAAIDTVAALRRLSEPVVLFMPHTLELVYMNKAATDSVAWTGESYVGKSVGDIPLSLDIPLLRRKLDDLLESRSEQVTIRLKHRGATFDASIQLITLQSGDQRYFAIFRDVSSELQMVAARQEFIATVSHELRTPLTAIKGAMGLLLSGATGELAAKSRNFVAIAHRNADRLVLIVNDILDLEKIVAGKMEFSRKICNLSDVLVEARMANQGYAEQYGVTVRLEGTDAPALAELDAERILQVLANLLSNACKFSKLGGEVVVAVAVLPDSIKVSISDSGIGIPAADLSQMFERFQQASNADRPNRGGSGLGLSIVKAIIEKHDGSVSLTSTEGICTTVTFSLPRAVDSTWPQSLQIVAG
ncbi:PAS/PAC sensor signal transduction histidine kinase [Pseudorhodobacter antarcticus]|uniref:histidine kinase n=1 Tax=Pseudorhodobacter antarcticus TaxID=1077947 RepID=A0A1H8NQ94_9RHOB|nr:ATP-binding protein [Pseudorhodobacter antarcticus]SEO31538.1 PAS/PAC sensor signal transduction histidine kinase [Pseudorhodobacter antarcticus]